MPRVRRVDYGAGCDFWLPCLSALERFWAEQLTTGSPISPFPTPIPKAAIDTSFNVVYGGESDSRLTAFVEIMGLAVIPLPIGDEIVIDAYFADRPWAYAVAYATAGGAVHPCQYDCMAWVYGGMHGENPP